MKKHHYVYLITNINTTTAMKYYIGMRSCDCDPKDDIYWGSSESLAPIINKSPQSFIKEILSTHDNRPLAVQEEVRLHNLYDVKNNTEYYNLANQSSTGFSVTAESLSKSHDVRVSKNSYLSGGVNAKSTWSNKSPEELKLISDSHKLRWSKIPYVDRINSYNKGIANRSVTYSESAQKGKQTCIDNGWYDKLSINMSELSNTMESNGKTVAQNRRAKQIEKDSLNINNEGLTELQVIGFKSQATLRNTIDPETGKTLMELKCEKISATNKIKMKGSGNPAFGTKLMNNGLINKRVKKTEIEQFISKGWVMGSKKKHHAELIAV